MRNHKDDNWSECISQFGNLRKVHDVVGICQKDLKPGNLMISITNEVRMIDFGNSELFFDENKHIYCHFEGTLEYMPPEYFKLSKVYCKGI